MPNRLEAGQRLNLDSKLTSPNGRFTLWMQPDSNLVLYDGTIDVSHAYWATGTNDLSARQRPTHFDMQVDAHAVLYDNTMTPRWSSGTWGLAFSSPYLALQDDGNLVIF